MKNPRPSRSAAALLVAMAIIVLVTILVVGLTIAMRMERSASRYHLERARADLLAREGVDYARALLQNATGTNTFFWVSGPGRIVNSSSASEAPTNMVQLSSGYTNTPGTSSNTDKSANLNRASWSGDRLLHPGGTNVHYKWIYVREDGQFTTSAATNTVGRFAFWVDDESARVNLNTAGRRNTNNRASTPTQIDLPALGFTQAEADSIDGYAGTNSFLTPLDAIGQFPGLADTLASNRFFLTHFSQTPDVNPWGKPRLVLTTRSANSTNRPFLNILTNSTNTSVDPGMLASLSAANLENVYTNIAASLSRTNWPFAAGNSFAAKYGTNGAAQLAIDVIEYVRSAESTNTFIEPLVTQATTNSLSPISPSATLDDSALGSALIGTTRRPMISQVGIYCSTNTNSAGYIGSVHAQLQLPSGYNAGTNAFTGWSLRTQISSSAGGGTNTNTAALGTVTFTNGYAACTASNITIPATLPAPIPTNTFLRVALLKDPANEISNILDIAPLDPAKSIPLATATNTTAYASANDPRLNKHLSQWAASGNLTGDAGPPTHSPNYSAYAGTPPSDGSADSVYFPSPGSTVGSSGEIGFIASGVNSSTLAPWRSIRLQPGSAANTNTLPDWALLELFSAPILPASSRFLPGTNSVSGRINLNSANLESGDFSRTNSLNALFSGVVSSANLPVVVSNVSRVKLATGGLNYGSSTNTTNFLSAGQLAEIAGISDSGESTESILRQVVDLATARSGVFSIYSIGQALQVTPANKVIVNGEKILKATIERRLNASGDPEFRVIYWGETAL